MMLGIKNDDHTIARSHELFHGSHLWEVTASKTLYWKGRPVIASASTVTLDQILWDYQLLVHIINTDWFENTAITAVCMPESALGGLWKAAQLKLGHLQGGKIVNGNQFASSLRLEDVTPVHFVPDDALSVPWSFEIDRCPALAQLHKLNPHTHQVLLERNDRV